MNYRKIWEEHYGIIPVDENNIPYEIHHIDGNHYNNEISNLVCVSINEHFNIHYAQGDLPACMLIAKRINDYLGGRFDKQLLSDISKRSNAERLNNGTHNFITEDHKAKNKTIQKKLYDSGKHHFCTGQDKRGKMSHESRVKKWKGLPEDEFFKLILTYNFYKIQKMRDGTARKIFNSIIKQAINCRYGNDIDAKNNIINKVMEYHNVNEACVFTK